MKKVIMLVAMLTVLGLGVKAQENSESVPVAEMNNLKGSYAQNIAALKDIGLRHELYFGAGLLDVYLMDKYDKFPSLFRIMRMMNVSEFLRV